MAGEGVILQKAREEKGWNYHDVEDTTKIRVRYLQALEQEEYNILPGDTYTKGFLRTYSRYLGLNPEEIINLYNLSLHKEPGSQDHISLKPIQNNTFWVKPAVIIIMALIAVGIVFGITYCSRIDNSQHTDYTPTPLPTAPVADNSTGENQKQTQPQPSKQSPSPVQYTGIVAELSFKEDCWLNVKVDGIIVEDGINAAGTTKVLQGTKRIEFVSIGNAGGISIKLNGIDIGSLGASREVVRNYVITEETIKNLSNKSNSVPKTGL